MASNAEEMRSQLGVIRPNRNDLKPLEGAFKGASNVKPALLFGAVGEAILLSHFKAKNRGTMERRSQPIGWHSSNLRLRRAFLEKLYTRPNVCGAADGLNAGQKLVSNNKTNANQVQPSPFFG